MYGVNPKIFIENPKIFWKMTLDKASTAWTRTIQNINRPIDLQFSICKKQAERTI